MSQEKPKVYSAEFRESAVKLANESDKPIAQTARDLGINENTLHTWISKYSRPVETAKAIRTDDHLYRVKAFEEGKRPIDRGTRSITCALWVKKAAAYFAKEQR
jgi:transposase